MSNKRFLDVLKKSVTYDNEDTIFIATVIEVIEDGESVTVQKLDDPEGLYTYGCQLKINTDSNFIVPSIDSKVMITKVKNEYFVIFISDVDIININSSEEVNIGSDAIVVGGTDTIDINSDAVNIVSNDTVKIESSQVAIFSSVESLKPLLEDLNDNITQLNTLVNSLNAIVISVNSNAVPVSVPTQTAIATSLSTLTTSFTSLALTITTIDTRIPTLLSDS